MNITFTDAACAYIKKKLQDTHAKAFRLSIEKKGCSNFSYLPKAINDINQEDIKIEVNDITIFIDKKWSHLMEGITVDYIEEDKMGLKQKRLVFINPNETSRCGCGESFNI